MYHIKYNTDQNCLFWLIIFTIIGHWYCDHLLGLYIRTQQIYGSWNHPSPSGIVVDRQCKCAGVSCPTGPFQTAATWLPLWRMKDRMSWSTPTACCPRKAASMLRSYKRARRDLAESRPFQPACRPNYTKSEVHTEVACWMFDNKHLQVSEMC